MKTDRGTETRWRRFALIGLLITAAGAFAGWQSAAPIYRCETTLQIDPGPYFPGAEERPGTEEVDALLEAQISFLRSARVRQYALETETMKSILPSDSMSGVRWLRDRLVVERPGKGHTISVACEHEDPEIAAGMSRAVATAYHELTKNQSIEKRVRELNVLKERRRQLRSEQAQLSEGVDVCIRRYGSPEGLRVLQERVVSRLAECILKRELLRSDRDEGKKPDVEGSAAPDAVHRRNDEYQRLEDRCSMLRKRAQEQYDDLQELEAFEVRLREIEGRVSLLEAGISELKSHLADWTGPAVLSHATASDARRRDGRPLRALLGSLPGLGVLAFVGLAVAGARRRRS